MKGLFVLNVAFVVSVVLAEVGVGLDGSTTAFDSSASVTIVNNHDVDVGVMWLGKSDAEIKVLDIGAKLQGRMDSHDGHRFVVRSLHNNAILSEFTVSAGEMTMQLGTPPAASAASSATRNGLHPQVSMMRGRKSSSVGAKFKSLSSRPMDMYWEDGRDGLEQGVLQPGKETTTNTYEGHVFYFTQKGKKSNEIARIHIYQNQSTYLIHDSPKYTIQGDAMELAVKEELYQKEYLTQNGIQYRHYYGPEGPRPPPSLYMWPADYIGQVHRAESTHGYWHCLGSSSECQSKEKLDIKLEVVSTEPKVYIVEDFFSDFEADQIIAFAKPRVTKSTVGQNDSGGVRKSDTRTSSNTWMSREASDISNTLYLRAADVLKVDEKILTADNNAEDMQVVHYAIGEKYDAHHDWGVSGYPESRYITLLLYLNDMPDSSSGGETSFPKGNGGTGIKVSPKKGTAVLFYSLLEDGNGDDLSLHQAMPVTKGEKWLANFWVWDPKKRVR